jgi:hypothetical protein
MTLIKLALQKVAEGEVPEKEKISDAKEEGKKEGEEQEQEQVPVNPDGSPIVSASQTPVTAGQENVMMDDNRPTASIKVNDIKAAVQEALVAGSGEKIIGFVKALAQQNPEAINEVAKIIKVELHSAFMNKLIDEESAIKISDSLNELLDGGKENE